MGLRGTLRIIEESWGFSIWSRGKQLGAAVGVQLTDVMAAIGARSWIVVSGKTQYVQVILA